MTKKLRLAVLASGTGSNFEAIQNSIQSGQLSAQICVLISDKPTAGALSIAQHQGIPTSVLAEREFPAHEDFVDAFLNTLESFKVDYVVLAGYLKMVPPAVVSAYRHRILNIHPALLPSFGGKGLYGRRVHEAVLERGCKVSGATVHFVDEEYDHGPIILQKCVPVRSDDTPESLAARVLKVEHRIYTEALQLVVDGRIEIEGRRVIEKNG